MLLQAPVSWGADSQVHFVSNIAPYDQLRIRRNYRDISGYLFPGYAFVLEGSPGQIVRISGWLDEIYATETGREVMDRIMDSGSLLTIRHSEWALVAAGRTQAPVSSHLTDGVGEDATILIDARIPDSGSHVVFDRNYQPIEFNAVQNLFHELVHAKHLMRGTWRYFNSEAQAIEEENIFRFETGRETGQEVVALRATKRGQQVWFPFD